MVKKKILFLILLTISLFLIAGCFEKKECETSYDCMKRECRTVQCVEGECMYNIISNCCGNDVCEPNVRENKCTCSKDCGECEGRATFKDEETGREKETEYLSYGCNEYDECVLTYDEKGIKPQEFFKEKIFDYFKLGITPVFDQPFDVFKSSFRVKLELQDAHEKLVLPINITGIKVLDRQKRILGEKDMRKQLEKVKDSFEEELNLFRGTDLLEEKKYVTLKIDYEYSVLEKIGSDEKGNPIYAPSAPNRKSFEHEFSDKMVFINPRAER